MSADLAHIRQVMAEADCLFTEAQVEAAIEQVGATICAELAERNPVVFCVMNGGLIFAGKLLTKLNFPLELSYLHATRYRSETTGGELFWKAKPEMSLIDRDVLIIDDIQELTGKTGTQNAFFNIFNHLQLAGKQLILTSDKPPVELKDIEQRLLTRFKWGLSAQLNTPDYDTKLKIIRAKAQKLGAQITDDVVAYLADNISANVREIEGALSSLVANASFLGRKITTSLAKEILKVYVKLYQKEITIDHIIKVVCEYLNLDFERFNSTERTREIAQARQIAMYLAKQHTKAPLTTIGAAIGGRNHATVLHSCKAVSNLIETDKAFRRQVEEIEKKVLAQ